MNVIDLRDELYKRRIDIIEIDEQRVTYAEELDGDGEPRIYIYSYDFDSEEERVLSFFTIEGSDYVEHYYACGDSIIVLFENDSNRAWLIKTDKYSGAELFRRKISLIGKFYDCVVIDDNNVIIYTKADDENRALFNRCLETTNSDTIANLYDLEKGYRYFVKDFKTAQLIRSGMYSFTTAKGDEKLLLCDPYCGESEKEKLVTSMSPQLKTSGDELRDNIWLISKSRLLGAIRSGVETLPLKRAASAGLEGTVRFECISGDMIIFRAKVYRTGLEQFFRMSAGNGRVEPLSQVRPKGDGSQYFTDKSCGRVYYLTEVNDRIRVEGEIGSSAEITYPERAGTLISCIDDRYIIADKSSGSPATAIYDSRLHITDTFEARAKIKGKTVVLY